MIEHWRRLPSEARMRLTIRVVNTVLLLALLAFAGRGLVTGAERSPMPPLAAGERG